MRFEPGRAAGFLEVLAGDLEIEREMDEQAQDRVRGGPRFRAEAVRITAQGELPVFDERQDRMLVFGGNVIDSEAGGLAGCPFPREPTVDQDAVREM